MDIYVASLIAFLTTCLFVWTLQPIAHRIGLVDKPGGRKKHSGRIPLIGGIAMFIGLLVGLVVVNFPFSEIKGLLIAGGILLIVGTIDDFVDLKAATRFLAQITAALILVFVDGIVLTDLGNLTGGENLELGLMGVVFTVFAIVGVINATNMSDGMDGLAGGLASITIFCLLLANTMAGGQTLEIPLPVILSIIIAFLMFNMRTPWNRNAQVFMGNGGSMFLGLALAWSLIYAAQGEKRIIEPVIALWIFALPLLDTICIMIRRLVKGRSPFAPDREHFHHILLVAGYTVKQAVWIMIGIALVLASIGYIGYAANLPEHMLLTGMLLIFTLYFWGMSHAWKVMKIIRRDKPLDKKH